MMVAFMAHYFIFQGFTTAWVSSSFDTAGLGTGPLASVGTAMYNLFGLMTTVNHPDVLMWMVDAKPAAFLFIITFHDC